MTSEVKKLKTVQLRSEDTADMQKIVAILVDFDNKTGRAERYSDIFRHHIRSAVATAPIKNLKFIIKEYCYIAEYVYLVTAIYRDLHNNESFTLSWTHEDGIKMERRNEPPEHQVHKIKCVTDMFEQGEEVIL